MVSNSTNTTYSGSAALKAMQQWYTMQDVSDSIKPYKVFSALLIQVEEPLTIEITSGPLIVGVSYYIQYSNAGDDFRNVGGPFIEANGEFEGTWFLAAGTTPTNYTHGTQMEYNLGTVKANVLENTIGDIWFTYGGTGSISANSDGLFTLNKTSATIANSFEHADSAEPTISRSGFINSTTLPFNTYLYTGGLTDYGLYNALIEIRVYN
jgi:hypothetical protein